MSSQRLISLRHWRPRRKWNRSRRARGTGSRSQQAQSDRQARAQHPRTPAAGREPVPEHREQQGAERDGWEEEAPHGHEIAADPGHVGHRDQPDQGARQPDMDVPARMTAQGGHQAQRDGRAGEQEGREVVPAALQAVQREADLDACGLGYPLAVVSVPPQEMGQPAQAQDRGRLQAGVQELARSPAREPDDEPRGENRRAPEHAIGSQQARGQGSQPGCPAACTLRVGEQPLPQQEARERHGHRLEPARGPQAQRRERGQEEPTGDRAGARQLEGARRAGQDQGQQQGPGGDGAQTCAERHVDAEPLEEGAPQHPQEVRVALDRRTLPQVEDQALALRQVTRVAEGDEGVVAQEPEAPGEPQVDGQGPGEGDPPGCAGVSERTLHAASQALRATERPATRASSGKAWDGERPGRQACRRPRTKRTVPRAESAVPRGGPQPAPTPALPVSVGSAPATDSTARAGPLCAFDSASGPQPARHVASQGLGVVDRVTAPVVVEAGVDIDTLPQPARDTCGFGTQPLRAEWS